MPMWYTKLIYLVLLIIGLFFSVLYEGIFSMLLLGVLILLPLTQLWLVHHVRRRLSISLSLAQTEMGRGTSQKLYCTLQNKSHFPLNYCHVTLDLQQVATERNRAVRIAAALAGEFCCNGFLSVRSDALRKTENLCKKMSHCRLFSPVQLFCAKMHGSGGDCCSLGAGRKFEYAQFAAVRDGGQCQLRPEPPRR